jgi:N-acyl-D-amino-acid deacylase
LNIATLIGHNTIREKVIGKAPRAAAPEEVARMKELVANAMRAGALGFSTGLAYAPGAFADTGEVIALASAAAAYNGLYVTHARFAASSRFIARPA